MDYTQIMTSAKDRQAIQETFVPVVHDPAARKFTKTRSGCSECKRKKVKCDEGRPSCKRCNRCPEKCRYTLTLSWTEGRPFKNPRKRRGIPYSTSKEQCSDPDLFQGQIQTAPMMDASSPTSILHSFLFAELPLLELGSEEDGVQRSDNFQATNIEKQKEDRTSREIARACPLGPAIRTPSTELLVHPKAQYFLHHYITNTSSVIFPLSLPNNPFRDVLVPRCMNTPYLLHAILASACSHHARLSTNSETKTRSQRLSCHFTNHCLVGLREEISTARTERIVEMILTALMLSMIDIISGDMGTWRAHLSGTRHLISQWIGDPSKDLCIRDSTQLFVIKWFASLDLYAGASGASGNTVLDGMYWSADKTLNPHRGYIDEFTGYSHELFPILSRISQMESVNRMQEGPTANPVFEINSMGSYLQTQKDDALKRECSSLEGSLIALMDRDVTPEFLRAATRSQAMDLRLTHRLFVQTTLLRLYCHVQGLPRKSPKVLQTLDNSFEFLEKLSMNSTANIIILWAVFSLGCMTDDVTHRDILVKRLRAMSTYGMGNVFRAEEILREYWDLGTMDTPASFSMKSVQDLILF